MLECWNGRRAGKQRSLGHSRAGLGVRWIVPEIVEFPRIVLKVVKLAPAGAMEDRQAVAAHFGQVIEGIYSETQGVES